MVDLGLEFTWQDNDYDDTVLGRTDDKRYGIFATLGFGDPRSWRGSVFGDYEKVELNARHRYINAGACGGAGAAATGPACFDPNQAPFPNAYNWNSSNKDDNWLLGAALTYPFSEKLKLTSSLTVRAQRRQRRYYGTRSATRCRSTTTTRTSKRPLTCALTTGINKNWGFSGGYTYQKYDWNDDQYDNYQYLAPPPPAALNTSTVVSERRVRVSAIQRQYLLGDRQVLLRLTGSSLRCTPAANVITYGTACPGALCYLCEAAVASLICFGGQRRPLTRIKSRRAHLWSAVNGYQHVRPACTVVRGTQLAVGSAACDVGHWCARCGSATGASIPRFFARFSITSMSFLSASTITRRKRAVSAHSPAHA